MLDMTDAMVLRGRCDRTQKRPSAGGPDGHSAGRRRRWVHPPPRASVGSLYVDLDAALSVFDRTEHNLRRLEEVLEQLEASVPPGIVSPGHLPRGASTTSFSASSTNW